MMRLVPKKYWKIPGGVGTEDNEFRVPGTEQQRRTEELRERLGHIPEHPAAIFKSKPAVDGGQAGDVQAHRAHGAVVLRGDGIERLHIGPQIRQAHQPLRRPRRVPFAAEPLPLLQHEGDQGAE